MAIIRKWVHLKYLDYNQPIDASAFTLNVPADAMIIDQTTQEVGLLQGQLTDKEIAVEVVRQFAQALISRDFVKAGQLLEGIPAQKWNRYLATLNICELFQLANLLQV